MADGDPELASIVEPHDKMRARDVHKVAKGEQAPRPPHEFGTVSSAPPPQASEPSPAAEAAEEEIELKTAPVDWRFPTTNQTHHCYARYIEYHRCMRELKGEEEAVCDKFARYYRSLCPSEWVSQRIYIMLFPVSFRIIILNCKSNSGRVLVIVADREMERSEREGHLSWPSLNL
ncbi:hypothetical protein Ancab_032930 [Ancistrocladus abbreviatus]